MSYNAHPSRIEQALWLALRAQYATTSQMSSPQLSTFAAHQNMKQVLDDPLFLQRCHPSWYHQEHGEHRLIGKKGLPSTMILHSHRTVRYIYLHALRTQLQTPQDILPYGLLDDTPLFRILELPYPLLEQLVHFLGLHDLAAQLVQVVDKKLVMAVHAILSTSQEQYLDYCVRQPRRWSPPKWDLTSWDKTAHSLWVWLFRQGLTRCIQACTREDHSFRWHLVRRFDKKWEPLYTQVMTDSLPRNLTDYFYQQLSSLLEHIE